MNRTQIILFLMLTVFVAAMANAHKWLDAQPRLDCPPQCVDDLLERHTTYFPVDTARKYIEQKANYGKGSLTSCFESWDTLLSYDVYGVYETDSCSILYYKITYNCHEEIKAALNPFGTRYPSLLLLYRQEYGDSLPSTRFSYDDGIFTVITKDQPGELIWHTNETFFINLSTGRFDKIGYTEKCFDEYGNPPEWFKDYEDGIEEEEKWIEIWPTQRQDDPLP